MRRISACSIMKVSSAGSDCSTIWLARTRFPLMRRPVFVPTVVAAASFLPT